MGAGLHCDQQMAVTRLRSPTKRAEWDPIVTWHSRGRGAAHNSWRRFELKSSLPHNFHRHSSVCPACRAAKLFTVRNYARSPICGVARQGKPRTKGGGQTDLRGEESCWKRNGGSRKLFLIFFPQKCDSRSGFRGRIASVWRPRRDGQKELVSQSSPILREWGK